MSDEDQYHVLVVEDEAAILRGVLRSIDRHPDLRSSGCYTVDEAVEVVATDPPDLLVTDLNLPGRNGLEMIAELEKAGRMIPIIVVTAYRAVYESFFPRHHEMVVLEKPVPAVVLLDHIHSLLAGTQTRPVGPAFQVSDYLQLAGMGRHSVILEVSVGENESGRLEVVEGELWNASFGRLTGKEAVLAMLDLPTNAVASLALIVLPEARQIEESIDALLLDQARRMDESRRSQQAAAGDAGSIESYAMAFEIGMKAVENEDWSGATAAFSRALERRPGDARARYNLERIHKMLTTESQ
jgi:DNA-binding response OmpR family regulator